MRLYAALDDRVLVIGHRDDGDDIRTDKRHASEHLVGRDPECLATSRATPDRVFVGTVESGLLRSRDGGETWDTVGEFEDRVTAVTVSPHDPDVIWVGTEPSAVYRSVDGGRIWEHREGLTDLSSSSRWSFPPRPHTHHVRWLNVDPRDPDRVYVAIEAGAFVRTTDGGRTWEDHPEGARRDNHTIATHPDAPGRVYVAAGDGYAESEDGGETWRYPQDGLDHRYVWGLAVDPGDPDRVVVSAASGARAAHWADTAEAYVYRRADDDDDRGWQRAMGGLPDPEGTVRAFLAPGLAAGEFVALTNRGLYRSEDGALSWDRLDVSWPGEYEEQVGRGLAVVP